MDQLPLFLPVAIAGVAIGWSVRQPLALRLGGGASVAWLFVAAIGLIVAATLTPLVVPGAAGAPPPSCDFSRVWAASPEAYLRPDDPGLNVLLFGPLGVAIGLLDRGRSRLLLAVAAFISPLVIELTQFALPALHRGCESADVIDNVAGLAIGLLVAQGHAMTAAILGRRQAGGRRFGDRAAGPQRRR